MPTPLLGETIVSYSGISLGAHFNHKREKRGLQVILSSKQSDNEIKYDPSLVQALFLHVLESSLLEKFVRAKLRPFLGKPSVSDELLMEKINIFVSTEAYIAIELSL